MDTAPAETADRIAAFTLGLSPVDLDRRTLRDAKRALLDTVACLIGGADSALGRIGRATAARSQPSGPGATVVGLSHRSTPEAATFANTMMLRYLDYNDTYYAPGGGALHLSDTVGAVLAAAEIADADGAELLAALTAGYEVGAALAKGSAIRSRGWDQGTYIAIAAAAASGRLLRLAQAELRDAVAIAATANIATLQTRSGRLGRWKGAATAAAAMNGVFAAVLASEGMTGPSDPFDGRYGLKAQVTGPFELGLPPVDGQFAVSRNNLKAHPSEYHSQGPIGLMLGLRSQVDPNRVEHIAVRTYRHAYTEIGMDREKWRPTDRETADHSLPFILAVALVDGEIFHTSFRPERWEDPGIASLMDRITITEDATLTARYPAEFVTEVEIVDVDGRRYEATTTNPHGHHTEPLTDVELEGKVDRLCAQAGLRVLGPELRDVIWTLDQRPAPDLIRVLAGVRIGASGRD